MRMRAGIVAALAAMVLAACSTPAPRSGTAATSPPRIATPALPVAMPQRAPSVVDTDTWARLRDSFQMHDCVAPAVQRAKRETRNRKRFEARLRALLPVIDYVQKVAERHDVAGEFVLLPWVESHFREVPPRPHRAAGMWQIAPITARGMHMQVDKAYDARLDKTVASDHVMRLLAGYYKHWGDWRLADFAYNTGEYRLRRILRQHGKPPANPVIPHLPVGSTTRKHLTRLLAIACVIRDPARFQVSLPALQVADRLQVVQLPAPLKLQHAARMAAIPLKQLRQLNAGYRTARMSDSSSLRLLLPATAAQTLEHGIAARTAAQAASADVALVQATDAGLLADNGTASPHRYTVAAGDSLWSIAREHALDVDELLRWNHLDDSMLHPGQVLRLRAPEAAASN